MVGFFWQASIIITIIIKIHQRLHHHHLEVVGDTSLSGASFSETYAIPQQIQRLCCQKYN